jgi:uncharacterized Fe-S cluster protein YjdI
LVNSLIDFPGQQEVLLSAPEKTYTNGKITVIWKPGVCIHSAKCVQGLGPVFNVNARPWINMQGSGSDSIVKQVEQCPSGALSYEKTSKASG